MKVADAPCAMSSAAPGWLRYWQSLGVATADQPTGADGHDRTCQKNGLLIWTAPMPLRVPMLRTVKVKRVPELSPTNTCLGMTDARAANEAPSTGAMPVLSTISRARDATPAARAIA